MRFNNFSIDMIQLKINCVDRNLKFGEVVDCIFYEFSKKDVFRNKSLRSSCTVYD